VLLFACPQFYPSFTRFSPATRHRVPVSSRIRLTFIFNLRDGRDGRTARDMIMSKLEAENLSVSPNIILSSCN
jgi:hypothetical protein